MDRCQWKTDHLYCWKEKKRKQNQGQQRSLSGDPATLILVTHFWRKKKAALEADTNKQIYKNSSVRNPTHPFHDYIITLCTKHKHHCPLTIKQNWKSHLHKSPCNVSNNLGWLSDIMNVTSCGHSHQINFDWLSAFQLSIKLLWKWPQLCRSPLSLSSPVVVWTHSVDIVDIQIHSFFFLIICSGESYFFMV